jgi:hypothetical protein
MIPSPREHEAAPWSSLLQRAWRRDADASFGQKVTPCRDLEDTNAQCVVWFGAQRVAATGQA